MKKSPVVKSVVVTVIFFAFITTIPLSRCQDDNQSFTECDRFYDCGKLRNLTYPFWGKGRRPQFCGHPAFELHCANDSTYPVMEVNGLELKVLNVSQKHNRMTLARSDLLKDPCSPLIMNTTLNGVPFIDYPPTVENLTLIYDCPQNESLQSFTTIFSCPGDTGISYYVNDSLLETIDELRVCRGGVVRVPVFRTAVDEKGGFDQVREALNKGFDVNYIEFPRCKSCERSGGRCGSDKSQEQFLCFCSYGPEQDSVCSVLRVGETRGWPLKLGVVVIIAGIAILLTCITICCCKKTTSTIRRPTRFWKCITRNRGQDLEAFIRSYENLTAKRYKFSDIKKMTKSFKDKLGKGGYGEVYKGKLLDGRVVAVKLLNTSKGDGQEFINEVASISRTSHVNIVELLGFSLEGRKRALIYEFMPNGSLEKYIYNDNPLQSAPQLEWEKLLQIAIGIARGLEYLHRGCNTRILHFDIKPHNILLDEDLYPKISDFGLAKLCPKKESIISLLDARGTIGYIAPEVFSRNFGGVSSKSDVYSYGMMILEMVGGRKNIKVGVSKTSEIYFPDWIYKHIEQGSNLGQWSEMTSEEDEIARKMVLVGLWCIQTLPSNRPSMSKVIEMLEGSFAALHLPPKPSMFAPRSPEVLPTELLAASSTASVL